VTDRSPPRSANVMDRSAFVERAVALLRPLLNFARSEVEAQVALGNLPPGAVSPEDVVDEALLEALRHVDEAPQDRLYPWLRGFVRRAIGRQVEEAGRRRQEERSLYEPIDTDRPASWGHVWPRLLIDILPDPTAEIPDQVVESEEFQQLLAKLLRQLPLIWREPFLLHVRDGLSLPEVARLEGVPVAEVRRRIERGREYLRTHLAEEYEDTSFPPPTEEIFELLDRIEPTPEQVERIRGRLESAAA
jgi:RNA polymerase sigma factor (sigma-70 family)